VPRALRGFLVVAEAEEARAVPETRALNFVETDFGDELRPNSGFLQFARAPSVRLGEAAVGRVFQERLDALEDVRVPARGYRCGTHVVHLPGVVVEPEEERRDARKKERETRGPRPEGEGDPDIAGIVPGPQPRLDEDEPQEP